MSEPKMGRFESLKWGIQHRILELEFRELARSLFLPSSCDRLNLPQAIDLHRSLLCLPNLVASELLVSENETAEPFDYNVVLGRETALPSPLSFRYNRN